MADTTEVLVGLPWRHLTGSWAFYDHKYLSQYLKGKGARIGCNHMQYDQTENSPTNKAAHRSSMWHCGHVMCCNLHSKIKIIIERRNTLTTASRPQLRGRLMWSMVFGFVLLYCVMKYGRQILIIMVHIDFGPVQVKHLDYGIKAFVTGQVGVVYGVRICIAVLRNEIWTSDINYHGTH